ncbi:hypothetical protein D3C86_1629310 [compost metagenome]
MRILFIAASAVVLAMPSVASAHPGGLNSEGCHNNRKTGDYHCHRGSQTARPPPVLRAWSEPLRAAAAPLPTARQPGRPAQRP